MSTPEQTRAEAHKPAKKIDIDAERMLAKVQATPGAVEAFKACVDRLEELWSAQAAFEQVLGWQVDGFTDCLGKDWSAHDFTPETVAQFLMQDEVELWEGAQ